MGYLGIRGNADRCDDVIRILKNLGGVDAGNWNGTEDDNIYYINPSTKLIDAHSLVVFDKEDVEKLNKFWKMTVEDFDTQFPFKEHDTVELTSDDICLQKRKFVIVSVRWDHVMDEVEYGLAEYKDDTIFGKPEIFRNADEIRYYNETTSSADSTSFLDSLIVTDKAKAQILLFNLSEYKVEVDGNFIKVIKK